MFIADYKSVSILMILTLFLLTSCVTAPEQQRLTFTNFAKIEEGVTTEAEVIRLLGEPKEVKSGSIDLNQIGAALGELGSWIGLDGLSDKPLSGTTATWKTADAEASVTFYKGKVFSKRFSKK
jgi:hypothetical protein